jgi:putative tryptophan/tyrosine transport system substrate-binding protein
MIVCQRLPTKSSRRAPNVITTMGSVAGVRIFQSETRTIPIVAWTGDPIAGRIISSLARPGGNVTGLSVQAGNIGGKHTAFRRGCG